MDHHVLSFSSVVVAAVSILFASSVWRRGQALLGRRAGQDGLLRDDTLLVAFEAFSSGSLGASATIRHPLLRSMVRLVAMELRTQISDHTLNSHVVVWNAFLVHLVQQLEQLPLSLLEVRSLGLETRHALVELVALVRQLLLAHLPLAHLSLAALNLLLCIGHGILSELVALLQVDDELVLAPDNLLISVDLFLELLNLDSLLLVHVVEEVVQGANLHIKTNELFVLDRLELLQLLDFFDGVALAFLKLLHHVEQVAHVVAAGLLEIRNNLLAHGHLVLVHLEVLHELAGVLDETSQILVLEVLALVQSGQITLNLINHAQAVVDFALGAHIELLGLLILVVFHGKRLDVDLILLLKDFEVGLVTNILFHGLLQLLLHDRFVLVNGSRRLQLDTLALLTARL